MEINCNVCDEKLNVPYSVITANPYREDFLCQPCEVDYEARSYGLLR
jgi:hypothetical protein